MKKVQEEAKVALRKVQEDVKRQADGEQQKVEN